MRQGSEKDEEVKLLPSIHCPAAASVIVFAPIKNLRDALYTKVVSCQPLLAVVPSSCLCNQRWPSACSRRPAGAARDCRPLYSEASPSAPLHWAPAPPQSATAAPTAAASIRQGAWGTGGWTGRTTDKERHQARAIETVYILYPDNKKSPIITKNKSISDHHKKWWYIRH